MGEYTIASWGTIRHDDVYHRMWDLYGGPWGTLKQAEEALEKMDEYFQSGTGFSLQGVGMSHWIVCHRQAAEEVVAARAAAAAQEQREREEEAAISPEEWQREEEAGEARLQEARSGWRARRQAIIDGLSPDIRRTIGSAYISRRSGRALVQFGRPQTLRGYLAGNGLDLWTIEIVHAHLGARWDRRTGGILGAV